MNIIIVGKKNGNRRIQWLNFFLLGTALGIIGGLGIASVYYLLCGRWSHTSVIYGIAIMIGMVLLGLINGLRTPLDKLQELK
jgi:hypothetical protein